MVTKWQKKWRSKWGKKRRKHGDKMATKWL